MPSPTEAYLAELRRQLRGDQLLSRRVIEEVADHFAEAVAAERRSGMSQKEAEENAVRRFGPADRFARQFDRFALPFKGLFLLASLATVGVGAWLFWVIAVMLPAHNSAQIPMWRTIAVCFFTYSVLSWTYLVRGPRNAVLRWTMLAASVVAIGLGLYGVVQMVLRAFAGADVEGYIVFVGLVLCGHGLVAIGYTLLTGRIARQFRAP